MFKRHLSSPSIDWEHKFRQKLPLVSNPHLMNFYQQGVESGDTAMEDVTFLAMDFETTGLNDKQDEIITIGTVPFNLNRVFLNQAKHWTVRPRRQLEEESVVIHGITHSDVLDAPDFSEIYQQVLDEMAGKILVVHYNQIERKFLDRALRTRIDEGIEFPVIDTLALESEIQKKLNGGIINRLKGKKPESVRLGQSRTRYGLPAYTPHHALTDAIATAELLQAQVAYHYNKQDALKQFWL
ncbi:DNA polymerase-3 subunit epsilon [Vibrio xiamenensis]|uniref:DNA-directed DNA polymerase n=1 Tax=Vibrio xiamenensis TaxID=861298 RepID=A0A1G7YJB8_9VIBR|nr:3'-5' exonuclease [Vibrio xiamenensis]SDG96642.1 DNA polymerase-3 subunit epsilon [Vibrio xiamenensis]